MGSTNYTDNVFPLERHTDTIIFLHGRDSKATQFAKEFFEIQASDDHVLPKIVPSVKWVFSSTGLRKPLRFGEQLPQWLTGVQRGTFGA